METRNGNKYHGFGVIANFLHIATDFLLNFIKTPLMILGLSGVHLVHSNNKLLHSQSVRQKGMLTGLAIL